MLWPPTELRRPNRRFGALSQLFAMNAFLVSILGWTVPAAAYRPFDGTNAAVVDVGEAQIVLLQRQCFPQFEMTQRPTTKRHHRRLSREPEVKEWQFFGKSLDTIELNDIGTPEYACQVGIAACIEANAENIDSLMLKRQ